MDDPENEYLSDNEYSQDSEVNEEPSPRGWQALVIALGITFVLMFLAILYVGKYSMTLFIGIPFSLGIIIAFMRDPKKMPLGLWFIPFSFIAILVLLILLGVEGVICFTMAAPLMFLPFIFGSFIGYGIRRWDLNNKASVLIFLLVANPFSFVYELNNPSQIESVVTTSVVINAPVHRAWQNLTRPVDLGNNPNFFFKAGVTFPRSMQIVHRHDSLYLHCENNNGVGELLIIQMKEDSIMKFALQNEVIPMREMSIYKSINPKHLHGYFKTPYGQFRLIALGNNKCTLEASTSYSYKLSPVKYWQLWTDYLIDKMQSQVINSVKQATENEGM